MTTRNKWPSVPQILSVLNDFADLADIVSRINGKLQPKDYFAIAMKSGAVGQRLYDRVLAFQHSRAGKHLVGWKHQPAWYPAFYALQAVGRIEADGAPSRIPGLTSMLLDGRIPLFFNTTLDPHGWAMRPSDEDELRDLFKKFVWSKSWVVQNYNPENFGVIPRPGIKRQCEDDFAARISRYLKADVRRLFLLTGLPGTGKTESCIRALSQLKLRTYMANASQLNHSSLLYAPDIGAQAIIIDDLDWTAPSDMSDVLARLSILHHNAKVILVTANRTSDLPAPMLRPGRVDEIIKWPGCTAEEVKALGAPERCVGWPIASVREAVTRIEVEGDVDLDEIERRIGEEPPKKSTPGGFMSGPAGRAILTNEPIPGDVDEPNGAIKESSGRTISART